MAGHIHTHMLHGSATVCIEDLRCRPTNCARGAEERSDAHGIAFVRSGAFVRHTNSDELVADSSRVLFFNRTEPYRISHPIGGDDCTSFTFDGDAVADAVGVCDPHAHDRPHRPFPFSDGPNEPGVYLAYQGLRRAVRSATLTPLATDELCLGLLGAAVRAAYRRRGVSPGRSKPVTRRAHKQLVDSTKLLLASEYSRSLSLPEIARGVHCSQFHLVRLFKRETGSTVHRHLNRLRLRAGLERLAEGEDNLTGLALDLGFASHSHFTDSFRREFGLSPSGFRSTLTTARLAQMSKILEA